MRDRIQFSLAPGFFLLLRRGKTRVPNVGQWIIILFFRANPLCSGKRSLRLFGDLIRRLIQKPFLPLLCLRGENSKSGTGTYFTLINDCEKKVFCSFRLSAYLQKNQEEGVSNNTRISDDKQFPSLFRSLVAREIKSPAVISFSPFASNPPPPSLLQKTTIAVAVSYKGEKRRRVFHSSHICTPWKCQS